MFHPDALIGFETVADRMRGELADLEARLSQPRYPFAGTVWRSRRAAAARAQYLRGQADLFGGAL